MLAHFGCYTNHSDKLICPKCGKTGTVVWEDVAAGRAGDTQKELVGIQGEFYERLSAKSPYPIELVCDSCGTIQSDETAHHLANMAAKNAAKATSLSPI